MRLKRRLGWRSQAPEATMSPMMRSPLSDPVFPPPLVRFATISSVS
jgi:hypothetical protein